MKLQDHMTVKDNVLHFSGVNTVQLAKTYATPLYVVSGDIIQKNYEHLSQSFSHHKLRTEIIYASKAFSTLEIYRLMHRLQASVDVVSGGEMYTAYKSGFPMDKVYFHGNNKSYHEIHMALDLGVGCFIVDNLMELTYLASLQRPIKLMLRVNPGIEAHTHKYVQTGHDASKFGISFDSPDLQEAIGCIQAHPLLKLKGLHCHIGSQIHDKQSFMKAALVMLDQIKRLEYKYSLHMTHLNLGGGFGIYYKDDDAMTDYSFMTQILDEISTYTDKHGLKINHVLVEPGRYLVGAAGITLYEAGFSKTTPCQKHYAFVNGGMTDNIRPALYQAEHEACIANNVYQDHKQSYTLAGKCCESGDVLIEALDLPCIQPRDIIAVTSTGAYNYSMASHYNRLPKPSVVLIENKQARLIVRRETYDDIIRQDV